MTWVKLCENVDTDRRIEDVSLEATGLFIRSVSYSARYLLDGVIDEKWVRRRVSNARKRQKLVEELVEAHLWRRTPTDTSWFPFATATSITSSATGRRPRLKNAAVTTRRRSATDGPRSGRRTAHLTEASPRDTPTTLLCVLGQGR